MRTVNSVRLFPYKIAIMVGLSSCYDYHYTYYTLDGKNYITRCDYMDSTYFMTGKQISLRKELGYVAIEDRDIRGGWSCWITWSKDTAYILERYRDFEIKGQPSTLKLVQVDDTLLHTIEVNRGKRYMTVAYK